MSADTKEMEALQSVLARLPNIQKLKLKPWNVQGMSPRVMIDQTLAKIRSNRFKGVLPSHLITELNCEVPDPCTKSRTVKPLYWSKPAYELDPTDAANNGFINQDFLVWMRRSALPNFRKLYRRITEGDYTDGLPAGNYSLEISYNYPVMDFDGRKKVVFSNVSWMGGKNEFLGIAYLVIGSLCLVMSVVMLIIYAKFKFPEED